MAIYVPDEKGEIAALDQAALAATEAIPTGDLGAAFAKMFLTLIALAILLFATYWFLRRLVQRRLQKGIGNGAIQIIEKKMVSHKTMLYLIEVDNKRVLIAESHLEIKRVEGFEHPRADH